MSEQSSKRSLPVDDDDAPPLGPEFFANARFRIGDEIIHPGNGIPPRRGRPPKGFGPKVQQSLRLSPEVLDWFRATGDGWQARIDEVLRDHVARQEAEQHAA